MADWSSLHEFHAEPIRFAHVSWLGQYPPSLVCAALKSAVCRRLLTRDLLDMHPSPPIQDFEVPEALAWALADVVQLRDLATSISALVFSPWIRRVISRPRIELITHAIGPDQFLSALDCSEPLRAEGDVVDVVSGIHDEAIMREFFVDVGWTCLLQLLTIQHPHLAWRFKLLGRDPRTYQPSPWQLRCEPDALLQRIPELAGQGVLA